MELQQNATNSLTPHELVEVALSLNQQAAYLRHALLTGRAGEFTTELVFAAFAARVQSRELVRLAEQASNESLPASSTT